MEEQHPLTKQQEGLWVEWKLYPENTSYNTCVKLKLTGELDKERFEKALLDVLKFFSSLRVYFVEENGIPYQRIKEEAHFDLQYEDLSANSAETPEQETQAKALMEQMLRTPVDLKQFPIVRAGLIKTAPDTHYFIGVVPHMISDGVSAVLFLEATSISYNQGYAGLEEAYGDNKKSWGDYFEESQSKYDDSFVDEASSYWRERMHGAQHTVDFSYGQKEVTNAQKTGKRIYFDLTPELSQRLKDYSRSQRTTLFSTLVGAFSLLNHRYYGQDDILIGYPVNIRPAGYKYLFGFFVNIIPIRVDLSGDPSFNDLVGRISVARKNDKKFQTFPALDIVREIRKEIPSFDGRVFNLSMAQTVSRLVNLRLDGIQSDPLEAEYNDVNDDLSLSYELLEDGRIGLWLEYRESLFDAPFIEQMIEHMQSLLAQVVEQPEKVLSDYELLDPSAHKVFLEDWALPEEGKNKSKTGDTIHGLVENYAAENPDTVALVYQDKEITYGEMNAKANQLARRILEAGAKTGDRIALCLRRGPHLIYGLLATLKAGCTYVPIAPCYPKERMNFVLQDADCTLLITQNDLLEKCEESDAKNILSVEANGPEYDGRNLDIEISENDLSYVIYTSGSTGNPKGVALQHSNVTPRLLWLQREIPLNEKDVVLQNTDYSFDVSVAEIFWPLTTGARLVLTESQKHKDPSYIIDLMKQHSVTTTCFVPSLLNSLLAVLKDNSLTSVKRILAAGEALPPTLVKTYYEKCSGELYNVYGPTEGAIYAAFKLCPKQDEAVSVPIGKPIGDTTLYILDEKQRPQPTLVAGELHIGGPGVAQGYINREGLTADKFIDNPFEQGQKLYRTGDLCRFLPNGDIEYLGRMDAQVKIRGFRIELAEIESVISSFDNIEDVAVIDHGEPKRLVAYFVSKQECDQEALKKHIESKVPEYMVPAFFVAIDEVPRLTSGKINRRALPSPENLVKKRAAYEPPKSTIEKKLAKIWSNILKIPASKIGIHDSFFEMGGDSLMAIQFVCAAEEEGVNFETDTLFTHNTIKDLSNIAHEGASKEAASQDVVEGTYNLLPRQAKFFDDGFKNPHHWNRFFYFDVDHDVELGKLQQAFDTVLMHHDNLRIAFQKNDQGEWQQVCKAELPSETYVFSHDLSDIPESEQEQKIVELCNDYQTKLDLSTAPLIRAVHFKTGNSAGKLGVIIHHLLIDIVASRIIFEDFLKSYESLRRNIEFPLPAKTSSAKDWVEHLYSFAEAHDFSEELAYWGSDAMTPAPSVPVDQKTSYAPESSAAQEKIILDAETTEALLQDIPKNHDIGIQDFLLACLLQTTKEWTDEHHLLVNICGHGRTGAPGLNLSRTAAWVNTVFPVHLSYEAGSVPSLVQSVKKQIQKVPAQNENYNLMRYSMQHPEITQHQTPEIFFNYVSQIDALLPEGLSFNPQEEPKGILSSDGENHLCYLLYMEAGIINKGLNIHVTYSTDVFKQETIEVFSALFKEKIIKSIQLLKEEQEKLYA